MFRPTLCLSALLALCLATSVRAETTPYHSPSPQPTLPPATNASPPKPGSPVVEQIVRENPTLNVQKKAAHRATPKHRHVARSHDRGRVLDRPALAGVELVAPLPPPGEPPHIIVPTPAFPLDAIASAYLTPPPPIVCHPTRRDRYAPDPRLYKEAPVECEADNP